MARVAQEADALALQQLRTELTRSQMANAAATGSVAPPIDASRLRSSDGNEMGAQLRLEPELDGPRMDLGSQTAFISTPRNGQRMSLYETEMAASHDPSERAIAQAATVEGCLRRERALRAELAAIKEALYSSNSSHAYTGHRQQHSSSSIGSARDSAAASAAARWAGGGGHGAEAVAVAEQERILGEELLHVTRELQYLQGLYAQSVAEGRAQQQRLQLTQTELAAQQQVSQTHAHSSLATSKPARTCM